MRIPGIVIAGTNSGVGKTTISMAIMFGLERRGYKVQPFKIGPDYIDPSYHNMITRRKSRNLDVWLMGRRGLIESYNTNSRDADIAVLEGVMGLYDGISGKNNFASTAHVSEILDLPVILVVDAKKAARSVAAIAYGFIKFGRNIKISGVILNNLASERHLKYVTDAFESNIKIPIIGNIFNNKKLTYHERHLGLVPGMELNSEEEISIVANTKLVSENIDCDNLIQILEKHHKTRLHKPNVFKSFSNELEENKSRIVHDTSTPKILVALDKSFNFYYQDNLDILSKKAQIEFFSPIDDTRIPHDCAGIILGGGFPEVLADKLEKNSEMKKKVKKLVDDGIPVYAECGGLMYLTRSISGFENTNRKYKMVGLFDADTLMTGKLTLGYTEGQLVCNQSFLKNLRQIKGHEFHYSMVIPHGKDIKMVYKLKKGKGIIDGLDGFCEENCVASYMHTHFVNSTISKYFIYSCLKYKRK
ncbi:MAG TPA: cobyrinate a,c-diamide synthase [Candidatus Nitrosocosmicus sp.]|nr:cobyrinate a,c-diamide synthase [Candidatus Nitrosocosmicus sp.]